MAVCWFTFRIHDDATAEARRKKLYEIAEKLTGIVPSPGKSNVWKEPTSFGLLNSLKTVKSTAEALSAALLKDRDLLVVRALSSKSTFVFGKVNDKVLLKKLIDTEYSEL